MIYKTIFSSLGGNWLAWTAYVEYFVRDYEKNV